MIKAVFFDWSGTLCDDHTNVSTHIWRFSISPYLFRTLPYTKVFSSIRYLVTITPFNTNFFSLNVSHSKTINSVLYPQTEDILQFLKSNKIFVGIVSLQPLATIQTELEKHNVLQYVDSINGGMHHKGALIYKHMKQHNLKK